MAINKTVNKSTSSHGAMRNCIEYVLKDEKIKDGFIEITGPYEEETIDYDKIYNSFLEEKRLWVKESGRMYAHNIISFHKDENISSEEALDFGREFAEKWFPDHQTLICVHQDRDHVHIHFVTNTVSFINGKKLHATKHDLQKMKNFTNKMCKERGLSIAEKGKHFDGLDRDMGDITAWSKDKYNLIQNQSKESFVADCALSIFEVLPSCSSKEDFISGMEKKGWTVNWTDKRKHITFVNEKGQKVRDSNISKTLNINISKEALNGKFIKQNRVTTEPTIGNDRLQSYYKEIELATIGGTDRGSITDNKKATKGTSEIAGGKSVASAKTTGAKRGNSSGTEKKPGTVRGKLSAPTGDSKLEGRQPELTRRTPKEKSLKTELRRLQEESREKERQSPKERKISKKQRKRN